MSTTRAAEVKWCVITGSVRVVKDPKRLSRAAVNPAEKPLRNPHMLGSGAGRPRTTYPRREPAAPSNKPRPSQSPSRARPNIDARDSNTKHVPHRYPDRTLAAVLFGSQNMCPKIHRFNLDNDVVEAPWTGPRIGLDFNNLAQTGYSNVGHPS
jgi:hypothetical protein